MGRLGRSWQLFKTSFTVIQQDKELLWMPVLSFLASVIAIAGIGGAGFVAGVFPETTTPEGGTDPVAVALGIAAYILLAFVQVFFFAATIAGANERLGGGDPTVGSSLRKAAQHLGRLFLWSIVVATVNIILQMIRERSGFLGQIMASIAGTAWNLATFFVVPILLFEDAGIGAGLKRSGGYFKRTWGETIAGEVGIGFIGGIVTIAILIAGVILTLALSMLGAIGLFVGIAITVIAVVLSVIIFTVAGAVYRAALYRYVSGNTGSGPFTEQQLGMAWKPV